MEGKKKTKTKFWKVALIGLSFVMTVVLTVGITLAWFFDSDWASNYVQMAGSVGIEVRKNGSEITTSGAGNLHFVITNNPANPGYAYPGQAVDVSASVYNNGGRSVQQSTGVGSPCFIRAHFAVYTDIGIDDPGTPEDESELEAALNAQAFYDFMQNLIALQNADISTTGYYWKYYSLTNSLPLSLTGTSAGNIKYYLEGQAYDTTVSTGDRGYFYLCDGTGGVQTDTLKVLNVADTASFLWNNRIIIPWTLSNASADKLIFVAVEFQAIQTFIPRIESGLIATDADNQLALASCTYNNTSVQTVFNSSAFDKFSTVLNIPGIGEVDFSTGDYQNISKPL